jgi:2-polyprenyl-3-methyl-5-hydroxy-6-metoxy-1,4-benzoquinol methylase
MRNRSPFFVVAAFGALFLTAFVGFQVSTVPTASQAWARSEGLDVPYVPTPQTVVDKMLEMANVSGDDYVIDLGSGDGRIPITAAKRYGAEAMGVDLDPARIKEAKANAKGAGVDDKVEFRQQDLFETDISKATVLTMYLLPKVNMQLRPRILSELKPGTRVVSHAFDMGDWKAERTEKVDGRTIYFWTVPSRDGQRAQK